MAVEGRQVQEERGRGRGKQACLSRPLNPPLKFLGGQEVPSALPGLQELFRYNSMKG